MSAPQTQELGGLGQSVRRKEDARFIRGQGRFVDDVQLPGMAYMKLVRSPYAHARLGEIDRRKCQVVEMRFFAGMSEQAIAQALDVTTRTVKRDWAFAKAWLYDQIA